MSKRTLRTGRTRDRGMTLPELLISVTLIGLLAAVISTAITVTFRQHEPTEGRLSLSVAEQNIDLWLPTDLASATSIMSGNPSATPCGGPVCGGIEIASGSTALVLSWTTRVGFNDDESYDTTTVAYHYAPTGDGTNHLVRIECFTPPNGSTTCQTITVLRELGVSVDADGNPLWWPGQPVPASVLEVTRPVNPLTGEEISEEENVTNARRVVVTVGGAAYGGDSNQIKITAGGTARETLDARGAYQMPSLVEPRSRCGGRMVLIVDESQSLGADGLTKVRAGVKGFVEALEGTPVQLQVVPFNDRARVLGAGSQWHRYFDLADPAEVTELVNLVSTQIQIGGGAGAGYTNWEDPWFRTFFEPDGSLTVDAPATVVFFTDGVPNKDRSSGNAYKATSDTADPTPLPAVPNSSRNWGTGANYNWAATASNFSMAGFLRAEAIASAFREDVRLVGVAVGPDVPKANNFVSNWTDPTYAGQWEQHANSTSNRPWERSTNSGSTWSRTDYSTYTAGIDGNPAANRFRQNPLNWSNVASYTSVPTSWNTSSGTFYQLKGERTLNSTIVGRLVGGTQIEEFVPSGNTFSNLDTGNLFTSPNWNDLQPALEKIALGDCGGTLTIQTRQNSASGPTVNSPNFVYLKAGEYQAASGATPGPAIDGAITGTTVVTNSVSKTGTFDLNMDDGTDRVLEIVPQGVGALTTLHYSDWVCRAGPNSVAFETIPIIENGVELTTWRGLRVRIGANQAVACTLVVT